MRTLPILLAALAGAASACTQPEKATELLRSQGYTNIQITGYKPFTCSDNDDYKTGFAALAPGGKRVSGAVCCGVLKGCTVRFD